jgi:hypothetical protein
MNGYLVGGKKLRVKPLEEGQPNPFDYKTGKRKYKYIDWKAKFVEGQKKVSLCCNLQEKSDE